MTDSNKIAILESIINNERISTQELLQQIYEKMDEGFNEFEIKASGQHNIGGPLWTKDNSSLKFRVTNPGQRVGSMGMHSTQIIVEGSAPADVGWLNAGAEIIVKGDGGDTTAHCAASGKIYIGGRVGSRAGALMKQDPKFAPPEFWVLKNTGSFCFEFMGGGIAVICGHDCENMDSILGQRACVGMVGGTVYIRGKVNDISNDVWMIDLDSKDKDFLLSGIKDFLAKIEQPELTEKLTDFGQWKKIVAKTFEERTKKPLMPLNQFRTEHWVEDGIFGDLIKEDYRVSDFIATDDLRIRTPEWENNQFSAPCEYKCPIGIPTQKRIGLLRDGKDEEAIKLALDYSPFPASVCGQVCPNLCMEDCNRQYIDMPVKVAELGLLSKKIKIQSPKTDKTQKIAIIGAGSAGLSAAWHLRKFGYNVEIFEEDKVIGGKLKQVIPKERLSQEILEAELNRFKELGVKIHTNHKIDNQQFKKLEESFDAIVIAVGAHTPVVIPFEGHERLLKGLDFLKEINKGNKPKIGSKVVVIGAGNAAMDVVIGAYAIGAKEVTAIDIQQPAAFEKEIQHAKDLGAKILYPCFTSKINEQGVHLKDGTLLEADTVIISVGDRPEFSFLENSYLDEKGKAKINKYTQLESNKKVFVTGDSVKLGLFTNAIADGKKAAFNIDRMFKGQKLDDFEQAPMIPRDKVKTQYYPGITPSKVESMDVQSEKERCLSCGFCRDCEFCINICPEQAIERIQVDNNEFKYVSNPHKCIGCGMCAGVCPCGIWTMKDNFITVQEA